MRCDPRIQPRSSGMEQPGGETRPSPMRRKLPQRMPASESRRSAARVSARSLRWALSWWFQPGGGRAEDDETPGASIEEVARSRNGPRDRTYALAGRAGPKERSLPATAGFLACARALPAACPRDAGPPPWRSSGDRDDSLAEAGWDNYSASAPDCSIWSWPSLVNLVQVKGTPPRERPRVASPAPGLRSTIGFRHLPLRSRTLRPHRRARLGRFRSTWR